MNSFMSFAVCIMPLRANLSPTYECVRVRARACVLKAVCLTSYFFQSPDAHVPRMLALIGLGLHHAYDWIMSAPSVPGQQQQQPAMHTDPQQQEADEDGVDGDYDDILMDLPIYQRKSSNFKIMGYAWDNWLLFTLFCCLLGLMYVRRNRVAVMPQQPPQQPQPQPAAAQ